MPKPDPNYGEWMLVTRKKHQVRNKQGQGTKLVNQQVGSTSKSTKGSLGTQNNQLTHSTSDKTFLFKAGKSQSVEAREGRVPNVSTSEIETCQDDPTTSNSPLNSGLGHQLSQRDGTVNKKARAMRSPHDKKHLLIKEFKLLEHPSPGLDITLNQALSIPSSKLSPLPSYGSN